MKAAILALAAIAPAHVASAQTWDWLATVDTPVLDPSKGVITQTVTLSVAMEYDTPFYILGAAVFDTLGTLNADRGHIVDWEVLNQLDELTGDLTTTDGVSLYGTYAGQLCTFTVCNTDNPLDVLEFTWQLDDLDPAAPFEVTYATDTSTAGIWAGEGPFESKFIPIDAPTEVAFGWTVVPSPSSLALGALAIITRRRRKIAPRSATAPRLGVTS
jgi:hypothetical protein